MRPALLSLLACSTGLLAGCADTEDHLDGAGGAAPDDPPGSQAAGGRATAGAGGGNSNGARAGAGQGGKVDLGPAPEAPIIDGEPSAGHTDLTWTWNEPALTDHFVVVLDGGAEQTLPLTTRRFDAQVELGAHTLEVRACSPLGACSAGQFSTLVELFGAQYSAPWRGVKKPDLATSPLGNVVPLSCHNCYSGRPGNVVLDTGAALAKIGRALSRGADLIEIDVTDAGGKLYASHEDVAAPGQHPTLQGLLDDETLRDSAALLFMEIKESDADPAAFAQSLLDVLDQNRAYAQNGRPIVLRHFQSGLRYLTALQELLPSYPMLRSYVRFSVLYPARSDIAALQLDIAADAEANGFWGIELEYRNPNAMGAVRYAQSLGLAAGLYTIPGPAFGEVYLGSLREEVDQLTTEYRVDQARLIIEAKNALGRIDASTLSLEAPVEVRQNLAALLTETRSLGNAPTAALYGGPGLLVNRAGEDLFGGILDFRSAQGFTRRALPLFDDNAGQGLGYLVTVIVNFDTLALASGQTMALLNKAEAGGFAVELANGGAGTQLRFGVNTGGGYAYHSYDVTGQNQAGACGGNEGGYFSSALDGTSSYVVTGAYDGSGGVYLFIDNRCVAATSVSASGGVTANAVPVLVGADPQPSAPEQAQFYFDGLLQTASVSSWGAHAGDAVNE
jgi:hypothetical protein